MQERADVERRLGLSAPATTTFSAASQAAADVLASSRHAVGPPAAYTAGFLAAAAEATSPGDPAPQASPRNGQASPRVQARSGSPMPRHAPARALSDFHTASGVAPASRSTSSPARGSSFLPVAERTSSPAQLVGDCSLACGMATPPLLRALAAEPLAPGERAARAEQARAFSPGETTPVAFPTLSAAGGHLAGSPGRRAASGQLHRALVRELPRAGMGRLQTQLDHDVTPWPIDQDASHHMGTT